MTKKQIALSAVEALKKEYPEAICTLVYHDPLHLLIATRLAAQCTDARVNMVTPALFERFPTAYDFAQATEEEVAEYIKSCGLFKTKSRDIVALSKIIVEKYDGQVPDSLDELIKLPGIGRKTANLVMGDVYGKPAVVVDTHFRELLPPEESNDFCHRLVLHGRAVCDARKPKCEECCMKDFCKRRI